MPFSTRKKKILSSAIILLLVAAGVFGLGRIFGVRPARADNGSVGILDVVLNPDDVALYFAGKLVQGIVWIGGQILAVLMWVLFKVAKYNNFIGSTAVVNGWFIARDICNIFFVVIFLVMTVATVLGIESYHYSRILTKLLIMVVLINFSKLICGIFIDVAQVIMLTFMNSFGELGSGYLTNILGITQLLEKAKINIKQGMETSFFTHFGSYLLVLIYVVVAIATILVITLVLVQRIIMLWIYVILSPFAYMLSAFPAGASYSSKWWDDFVKYVTIGPIIAFFVWLSFVSLGNVKTQNTFTGLEGEMSEQDIKKETASLGTPKDIGGLPQAGETEAGSPSHMVKFIFGIAMLIGGLMVAQTIGGMAGSFAGGTIKNLQTAGAAPIKAAWSGVKAGADWGNLKLAKKTGQDLHLGRRIADFKEGFARKKKKDIADVYSRAKELSKRGGFTGYVGSMGTKDFIDQKVRGVLGLKGVGEAIATSNTLSLGGRLWRGSVERDKKDEKNAREKVKTLTEEKSNIITNTEYSEKLTKLNEEESKIKTKSDNDVKERQRLQDYTEKLKNDLKTESDYKKRKNLEKEIKENGDSLKLIDSTINEDTAKLNKINAEKVEFYNKKAMGDRGEEGGIRVVSEAEKAVEQANLDNEIKDQNEIIRKTAHRQVKYMPLTPETDAVERAAMAEAGKNLPDTSEQLRDQYRLARLQKDAPKMKAILLKLMQNDDLNDILVDEGFGELPGWSEKDVERWKDEGKTEEEIENLKKKSKGLSDFMRREFEGILPEQQMLGFQMDIANVAKKLNNASFMETVSSKYGKYEQNDLKTQTILANDHLNKQDSESLARRGSRWALGLGISPDGHSRFSAAGLKFAIENAGIITTEIDKKRFPVKNALMMTDPANMEIMRDTLKTLTGAQKEGFEKMINAVGKFSEKIRAGDKEVSKNIYRYMQFLENRDE